MITFKNELPIDHELSLDHLVKVWSIKEAENDDGRWEDYTEYVWWGIEEWMETHCETW